MMKIDQNAVRELLSHSDAEVWQTIRQIAGSKGFRLPEKTPDPAQMQKLRATLGDPSGIRLGDAIRIVNEYRKEERKS